jgi:hypothetical protein
VAIDGGLKAGGHLLALGLDGAEAETFLPFKEKTRQGEHIAAFFAPFSKGSLFAGVGPADVHSRDPRMLPLVVGGAAVIGDGVLARAERANVIFCQLVPWQFDAKQPMNQKRTFRRAAYLVTRLAANMGVAGPTPVLTRFRHPTNPTEKRWLKGLYLDVPDEWDDPYRFFRW